MTKKFIFTVSILAIAIIVVSASLFYLNIYYPPKPKDTNLKYWVGERISKEQREEYGFTELVIPGLIGGGWYYLDGDYKAKLEYSPGIPLNIFIINFNFFVVFTFFIFYFYIIINQRRRFFYF